MKIKFNLQYPNSEFTLIMATIHGNGKTVKRSTTLKVCPALWDKTIQRCSVQGLSQHKERQLKRINKTLDAITTRWDEVCNKYKLNPHDISGGVAKAFLDNIVKHSNDKAKEEELKANRTPTQFFKDYADNMTSQLNPTTKTYKSKKTQGHHYTVLERFKKFLVDTHGRDSFDIFDDKFEQKFTEWANKTREYSHNTIVATFSVLKVWLNRATKEGIITTSNYKELPSKGSDADNIALTENEITALYNLDIPKLKKEDVLDAKGEYEITRDLFIVGCWTGLRRADLNRLNEGVFNFKEGMGTLTIQAQKTHQKVTIPLHPYVQEIYKKYNGNFPTLIDKSKTNHHLRELGRIAGINDMTLLTQVNGGKNIEKRMMKYQRIGFHTARRSFATNLYLREGTRTISIMALTGHKSEKNFLKYIKVSAEQHAEVMQKYLN